MPCPLCNDRGTTIDLHPIGDRYCSCPVGEALARDELVVSHRAKAPVALPNPSQAMLNGDRLFDAIYSVIKSWDVNVPEFYQGYCGANGSHATLIYDAIKDVIESRTETEKLLARASRLREQKPQEETSDRPCLFRIEVTDIGMLGRAFEARLPNGQVVGLTIPDHEQERFRAAAKEALETPTARTAHQRIVEDDAV